MHNILVSYISYALSSADFLKSFLCLSATDIIVGCEDMLLAINCLRQAATNKQYSLNLQQHASDNACIINMASNV